MDTKKTSHSARRGSARSASILCALVLALTGCGWIAHQATIAYIAVNSRFSPGRIEIELGRAFIEEYKSRVAIHATLTVDKAMAAPLPSVMDGDLHFAGRAPEVALPVVAEIANAKDEKPAIDLLQGAEGSGRPLKVSVARSESSRARCRSSAKPGSTTTSSSS